MAGVVLWGARREATKVLKKGHSEEKILRALHQAEGGEKVADICEHGTLKALCFLEFLEPHVGFEPTTC